MIRVSGKINGKLDYTLRTAGEINCTIPSFAHGGEVWLETSILNSDDLVHLLVLGDHLKNKNCEVNGLDIGYLAYGRADREINGEPNGCRTICQLLRNAFPRTIIEVIDAHNPRVLECFGIKSRYPYMWGLLSMSDVSVVAPDAGSHDRAYTFFNKVVKGKGDSNFIQCTKTRSENGSPITCLPEADYKKKCVIVDDIIDGGRTFSDLASKLRAKGATEVELVVTHGIFSYGFDIPGIDKIYTTNTYLENDPAIDPKNKHIVYYREMF